MTDVMTCGYYPDEPLPGPRGVIHMVESKRKLPSPTMPNAPYVWTDTPPVAMPNRPYVWRDANPVLEDPMYFPGNAWKGTSGMPQHRYA
jgi:hypothetical protein